MGGRLLPLPYILLLFLIDHALPLPSSLGSYYTCVPFTAYLGGLPQACSCQFFTNIPKLQEKTLGESSAREKLHPGREVTVTETVRRQSHVHSQKKRAACHPLTLARILCSNVILPTNPRSSHVS